MFRKSWMKQVQAITYMILIVFLYLTLDGNIGGQFSNIETKEVREAGGQFSILKEMNVFPQSSKSEETQEAQYDILIDLTESMLYLFENDKLLKKYPVAQGKVSTPSPVGIWKITSKARNWGSGFGTRWMGLNVPWGVYGIHGTNKPGSIGRHASAGCFRMRNKDVEELYSLVPYKTTVVVHDGPYGNMGSSFAKLEPGDRNSQVAEVQKRLQKLDYYTGSIDGIYGEGMKAALIRFKRDNNLPVNHYVDWATYRALGILSFE
ncbi:MAG: L,D-transpeptidase family protein [Clostridia bacterium]|nr:L,D-transpeptidase family protein [Clostridia bacterium]MDD4679339.1 L,D-transpeptidase family protein [Clostridia bacterium]